MVCLISQLLSSFLTLMIDLRQHTVIEATMVSMSDLKLQPRALALKAERVEVPSG